MVYSFRKIIHYDSAFFDADWVGNYGDDCTSTSTYIIFWFTILVLGLRRSKKSIVRSSTKAEYCVISTSTFELSWIKSLLCELQKSLPNTTTIYCDNSGATYLHATVCFTLALNILLLTFILFVIKSPMINCVCRMSPLTINLMMPTTPLTSIQN